MTDTLLSTNEATLEISLDNSTWYRVPGVASISESQSAPAQITRTDYAGHHTVYGRPRPPKLEIALPGLMMSDATTSYLWSAQQNRTSIWMRYTVPGDIIWSSHSTNMLVSITADGTATFANDTGLDFDQLLAAGMTILSDGGRHDVIRGWVNRTRTVYVDPNIVPIIGHRFSFTIPGFRRRSFQARVESWLDLVLDANSPVTTKLTVVADAPLDPPIIHNTWRGI